MLICVGGFPGSGRSVLAKYLAKQLGYYYYDVDRKKSRASVFTSKGLRDMVRNPASDVERAFLYERILEDLPVLSKMYPDMVMDTVFHRSVRDRFFTSAKPYFSAHLFIWIESDDTSAERRLQSTGRYGENLIRRRKAVKKEFEELEASIPVFTYADSLDNAKEPFFRFVQEALRRQTNKKASGVRYGLRKQ